MEWKWKQDLCPYFDTVLEQKQMQEQTQEIRLADGMPDVGRVLGCRGQVVIRGKEWLADQIGVNGGVLVKVLYVPEDGSEVRCVDCRLPFHMKWDLPQGCPEGVVHLQTVLRGLDARVLSARKLMVRGVVGVAAKAVVAAQTPIFTPEQSEADVQLLRQTYPVTMIREAGEKSFSVDEELTVPEGMPQVRKVLSAWLEPMVSESKVLAGRLVFRGEIGAHILYSDADGAVCHLDARFPVSQYAQLEKDHSSHARTDVEMILTSVEAEADPEGRIRLQCAMSAQYTIRDRVTLEVVTDAYSPRRQVEQTMVMLDMPVCMDQLSREISIRKSVPIQAKRIVDITWHPDITGGLRHSEGTQLELQGSFEILYLDESESLQGHIARFEDGLVLSMAQQSRLSTRLRWDASPQVVIREESVEVTGTLTVDADIWGPAGIPMITQMELGALQPPDPGRPSLILRRVCEDSLWEMAKACGSTVEAIRKANRLEGEPEPDTLVLIPVP